MDKLPSDVLTLIFQFDPTYHEQYKQVLLELHSRTMWRLVWVNVDIGTQYFRDRDYFDHCVNYWNKTYPEYHGLTPDNNLQQCTEGVIKLEDVK